MRQPPVGKRRLRRWLLDNDFEEVPRGPTGHARYRHRPTGLSVTISDHGRDEMSKTHVSMILRTLEGAGFDRRAVREELAGDRKETK